MRSKEDNYSQRKLQQTNVAAEIAAQNDDDRPVGRVLSRREVLVLLGAAGTAVLAGCAPGQSGATQPATGATQAPTSAAATQVPSATSVAALPACIVRPALTEGPYFVDEKINRSDIRSDPSDGAVKDGALLNLTLRVSQVNGSGCAPLADAQVDIWHCDALGVYSDASDPSFDTKGKKFLRGYQVTDANGIVQFTTIYPGWYQGRAVHIHFKIRTDPGSNTGYEFTSQWFFDDSSTDQVHAQQPYAAKGQRTLRNDGDGIYQQSGGQTLLDVAKSGDGYAATFDIGLQMG
jgi:protocatechuate 3,4-dioxygenase beta subunit